MGLPIVQIDAFTDQPFAGNPAAVCMLLEPRPDAWMQAVAREMNLAETAFLLPTGDGYALRWFTPVAEVDLCGHATLASAHALWEQGLLAADAPAHFHTRSGCSPAARRGRGSPSTSRPAAGRPATPPPDLDPRPSALAPVTSGRTSMTYLVQLPNEAAVRGLDPESGRPAALGVRGVIVTAVAATLGVDFVSRFFAPRCRGRRRTR